MSEDSEERVRHWRKKDETARGQESDGYENRIIPNGIPYHRPSKRGKTIVATSKLNYRPFQPDLSIRQTLTEIHP